MISVMKPDAVLPVVALILTIYLVTKLREGLGKQAMFAPPLSRVGMGERIAQGAQLALGILLALVVLTGVWGSRITPETNTKPSAAPIEHQVRVRLHRGKRRRADRPHR